MVFPTNLKEIDFKTLYSNLHKNDNNLDLSIHSFNSPNLIRFVLLCILKYKIFEIEFASLWNTSMATFRIFSKYFKTHK